MKFAFPVQKGFVYLYRVRYFAGRSLSLTKYHTSKYIHMCSKSSVADYIYIYIYYGCSVIVSPHLPVSRPGLDDPLRTLRPGRGGERTEGEVRASPRDQPDFPQREGGDRGRPRHEPAGVLCGLFRAMVRHALHLDPPRLEPPANFS